MAKSESKRLIKRYRVGRSNTLQPKGNHKGRRQHRQRFNRYGVRSSRRNHQHYRAATGLLRVRLVSRPGASMDIQHDSWHIRRRCVPHY